MATLASLSEAALRPGRQVVVRVGGLAGREARRVLAEPSRRAVLSTLDAALAGLDAALRSSLTQEMVNRVLDSPVTDDLLDRLIGRVGNSPELEQLVSRVVNNPELEQLVGRLVDSPELEPLVGRVVDSRLLDAAMLKLLESDGLWLLVEEIAQSPAVTAAISRQGVGFANQMAGVVRERSRTADDRLERLARRVPGLRRRPASAATADPPGDEQPAVVDGFAQDARAET